MIVLPYIKNGSLDEFMRDNPITDTRFTKIVCKLFGNESMITEESFGNDRSLGSCEHLHIFTRGNHQYFMVTFIRCVCWAILILSNCLTGLLQANILIDDDRRPLICDFGLSRIRHEVTRANTEIREGGKLRFLAPELLKGMTGKFRTSEASDIFSLSMTLLHLWAHQPPFAHLSNDRQAEAAIRRGERPPRPLDDLGMPSDRMESFWLLIQRMWDDEAGHRPATEEVRLQLEVIFASLPS